MGDRQDRRDRREIVTAWQAEYGVLATLRSGDAPYGLKGGSLTQSPLLSSRGEHQRAVAGALIAADQLVHVAGTHGTEPV